MNNEIRLIVNSFRVFNVPKLLLILVIEYNGCTRSTCYSICRLNFAEVNAMGKLNKYFESQTIDIN